ncbi:MAG: hypothetical protein IKM42_07465 [Clostridia bacterium]|nr:hypothetical protein [Clostridia bacterium]
MFGYVKIEKAELRVREYEYYRAAYCGLCRSMGKCTGQCSRLTLSYDIAFLAQVRMALVGTEPRFKKRHCIAHPFRARMMMEPNAELSYAADASALLAYEKCRDDVADKRGFSRMLAVVKRWFTSGAYRRAKRRHPALAALLRERLTALAALEGERRATVDEPAAIFGEILAALFGEGLPQDAARIAEAIGTKVGRFIYIVDAIDDMARDERSGNFNPLLLLFDAKPTTEQRQMLEDALLSLLDDAATALDLVGGGTRYPYRAVLENILYLGMPAVAKRIIWGDVACRKEEVSE